MLASPPASLLSSIPSVEAATPTTGVRMNISPDHVASLADVPGTSVNFDVNITNAPSIEGVLVRLSYNRVVLNVSSLDITGNRLGVTSPFSECVPDLGISIECGGFLGVSGELLVFLLIQGGNTTAPTNGLLFHMTFRVRALGFSELHFLTSFITKFSPSGSVFVPFTPHDGYFTNVDCPRGSGVLCTPPVPFFTFSPSRKANDNTTQFAVRQTIQFDGSKSNSTNSGSKIVAWSWDWGDRSSELQDPIPKTTHTYLLPNPGLTLTLTVNDTYGISSSASIPIQVILTWIQVFISGMSAEPHIRVLPGAIVNITAQIQNLSTKSENVTARISVENRTIENFSWQNVPSDQTREFSAPWDTTGSTPRVYRVNAIVDPVRNSTTGLIIQNDTSSDQASVYIQLIESLPPGFGSLLGLNLVQSSLLGIVGVLVIGTVVPFIRRRRKPTEALE